MIACEAGLRAEGLDAGGSVPGVEVAGVARSSRPTDRADRRAL